jgi:hypothetical protein
VIGRESTEYTVKRQRKEVLENLGRVAIVGLRNDSIFKSYGLTEKLTTPVWWEFLLTPIF